MIETTSISTSNCIPGNQLGKIGCACIRKPGIQNTTEKNFPFRDHLHAKLQALNLEVSKSRRKIQDFTEILIHFLLAFYL